MLEITNMTRGPIQLVFRSIDGSMVTTNSTKAFSTLSLPGLGSGQNVIKVPDEWVTPRIKKLENETGFIKTRYIKE